MDYADPSKVLLDLATGGEGVAIRELAEQGYGADDIEALYTERSPCPMQCQLLLNRVELSEDRVFWSFDYNVSFWARRQYTNQIAAEVARFRDAQ